MIDQGAHNGRPGRRRSAALGLALAGAAAVALGGGASAADAAPGFTAPILVAHSTAVFPDNDDDIQLVGCVALSGDAIGWGQVQDVDAVAGRIAQDGHVAMLGPTGAVGDTVLGPPHHLGTCPSVAAAGPHAVGLDTVFANTSINDSGVLRGGPLYLGVPGAGARSLATTGLAPVAALAPDGSGVVAWLHDVGGLRYGVYAARVRSDGTLTAAARLGVGARAEGREAQNFIPPVVSADDDGAVEVAWSSFTDKGRATVVRVSQAGAGAGFGRPQTLAWPRGLYEQLQLAGNGSGRHVLQAVRVVSAGPRGLWSATQARHGARFHTGPPLFATSIDDPLPAGFAMDAGGATTELTEQEGGTLAVERMPAGGRFGAPVAILHPGRDEELQDAALAVAADGRAAVAWTESDAGPMGGFVTRVMLRTAPAHGGFSAPVAVSGLAPSAESVAATYDSTGQLRIAWTGGDRRLAGTDVTAVLGAPGGPDLAAAPGPALSVTAVQPNAPQVDATLTVDRACLVRVQAIGPGLDNGDNGGDDGELTDDRESGLDSASYRFTGPGTTTLHLPLEEAIALPKHATVRVVAYATDASGASTAAQQSVNVTISR